MQNRSLSAFKVITVSLIKIYVGKIRGASFTTIDTSNN